MKHLEKLIGPALEAVVAARLSKDGRSVEKEYDGYAASFGPALRTSGLLPTLAFYSDYHKDKNKPRRNHLLKALFHVINKLDELPRKPSEPRPLETFFQLVEKMKEEPVKRGEGILLLAAVGLKVHEQKDLEKALLMASIAIKLALRNFEQKD